jgi:hypothetical protein
MFNPSLHPVYKLPTKEQYLAHPEAVAKYLQEREKRIQLEIADPLRYGFEPERTAPATSSIVVPRCYVRSVLCRTDSREVCLEKRALPSFKHTDNPRKT